MERKPKMNIGIGGPSIIMIFVILCLATLGALSLMTANADWKLTQKSTTSSQQFYTADNEAEEMIAQVDASLQAGQSLPEEVHFLIPVSETQNLLLIINTQGNRYDVVSRKLVPAKDWDYDSYKIEFDSTLVE